MSVTFRLAPPGSPWPVVGPDCCDECDDVLLWCQDRNADDNPCLSCDVPALLPPARPQGPRGNDDMNDDLDRAAVERALEKAGVAERHGWHVDLPPATVAALCRGWVERDEANRHAQDVNADMAAAEDVLLDAGHDGMTLVDLATAAVRRAEAAESERDDLRALLAEARAAHDAQTAQHVRDVDAANRRAEVAEAAVRDAWRKLPFDHPAEDGGLDNCPTFHDGCHCNVETLRYNIARAEAAEGKLGEAEFGDLFRHQSCGTCGFQWVIEQADDEPIAPCSRCEADALHSETIVLQAKIDAAEAERDRMREALDDVSDAWCEIANLIPDDPEIVRHGRALTEALDRVAFVPPPNAP